MFTPKYVRVDQYCDSEMLFTEIRKQNDINAAFKVTSFNKPDFTNYLYFIFNWCNRKVIKRKCDSFISHLHINHKRTTLKALTLAMHIQFWRLTSNQTHIIIITIINAIP